MKRVIAIATATVLTMLVALTLSVAAQQPDTRDRTIMTFSSAVELPGMRLEPGKYVFRLADSASRNVIQVLDEEEKETLGQWLFVSAERPEVTGDTVVTFRETSAASTPAVQYWFYPGEKIGKEFIYPKDQAMRIAKRTGATVQTEEGPLDASGEVAGAAPAAAEPQASAEPVQQQASIADDSRDSNVANGSGLPDAQPETAGTSGRSQQSETVGTAGQAQQAPPAADTAARNQSELPATASPLALSGLLGLLSLAGAAGIRFFRL
jgi:hypothetical protein